MLTTSGPNHGYHVNSSKLCWLIVHPGKAEEARRIFNGTPINITEDGHPIGSAIGTEDYIRSFCDAKCKVYVREIDRLTEVGKKEPHLAILA